MAKKKIEKIDDLERDDDNARRHTERNIGMIARALEEVGAARSIVIDENGRVLAGAGVLEGAAQVGIENVIIVPADGNTIVAVQREGLTDEQKKRLAYYDNRTGELSEWDAAQILRDAEEGFDFDGILTADEIEEHAENAAFEAMLEALLDAGIAEESTDGIGLSGWRAKSVKVVISVDDVEIVEQALRRTGRINRGEALLEICQFYLQNFGTG